jgi:hypothetical protein
MTSIATAISIARPTRELHLRMVWAVCLAAASVVTIQATNDASVTADQVNGTWKTKGAEFKIWALGKQRVQIEFSGVYEYKTPQGPTANEGEGSGVATIEGDTAIFKPEGAEEECQITLRFTGGKLVVTQTGICGFGHNVSAAGTYKKVSAREPKFGSD